MPAAYCTACNSLHWQSLKWGEKITKTECSKCGEYATLTRPAIENGRYVAKERSKK